MCLLMLTSLMILICFYKICFLGNGDLENRYIEAGSYEKTKFFMRMRKVFSMYKIIYDSHTKIHVQKSCTKSYMIHVQNHL